MPDPKLKAAAEEIKSILVKYDIAAVVVLASQSHMEYLNHVIASWSCATLEKDAGRFMLRIRAKREDFPSKEAQKKCVEDTTGMIMGFADAQLHCHEMMLKVAAMIGQQVPFEHFTTEEPHDDENRRK